MNGTWRLLRLPAALCALLVATLLSACSHPGVRFADRPPVTAVADDTDIPEPAETEFYRYSHHLNNFGDRQLRLRLDPLPAEPAQDVNSMGEVPNSSWFHNRVSGVTPEQVAAGAGENDPGPESFFPWTVTGMKVGGANPGFVFEDARGVRYLCKVDKVGEPNVATGAGAIAARLFWLMGYHTPDDRVVYFDREQLQIGNEATYKTQKGRRKPVTQEKLDQLLADRAGRNASGQYRVLVSRFLPGRPVGGYSYTGTRKDDANDVIPHQNRRSLRGLRVFGAWLNHVDLKIDNTLDLYTESEGRRFVRHYLVDFDGCLGGYWAARHEARIGFAYEFDMREFVTGTATAGLYKRPYEHLVEAVHPEIGELEAEVYDPAGWRQNYLNDQLIGMRPADAFWAGNILAQISEDHIRAAAGAARYDDASAEVIVTSILITRWEKTVDWALTQVSPVVDLEPVPSAGADRGLTVEARDALIVYGRPSALDYRVRILEPDGSVIAEVQDSGAPAILLSDNTLAGREYIVIEWVAISNGDTLPPTHAHYVAGPSGWSLVGILRDGE
jgi:hypothetical protein